MQKAMGVMEGIQDKDYNFFGEQQIPNSLTRDYFMSERLRVDI